MNQIKRVLAGRVLPWVLFGLAVGVAVALCLTLNARNNDEDAAKEGLRKSANRFVLSLTNFSSDTIDQDVADIREFATGDFENQVDELFSPSTIEAIKTAQAVSTATVEALYIQSFTDEDAVIFAVLNEEISNTTLDQPRSDIVRMEVGLVQVGDDWKVDSVELVQSPDIIPAG